MVLRRIARHVRLDENELRYQLALEGHPHAQAPELLLDLAALERDGLIDVRMEFSLTAAGKDALCPAS
jgi:hypothetical protein